MKMKKYLILVIVSFSILVVVWRAQQSLILFTGETDLSAKEKKVYNSLDALEEFDPPFKIVEANKREVLQGLEGVWVFFDYINPKAEEYGFRIQALWKDTELQLRRYGIKVLNTEELFSTPGEPRLHINVDVAIAEGSPVAAVTVSIELNEVVLLSREPKEICMGACTWHRDSVALVRLSRINDIGEYVKVLVAKFIIDYLAANQKEQTPQQKTEK